ncbi:MAG: PilW family protein [Candidatus Hydrogenedens sp.]
MDTRRISTIKNRLLLCPRQRGFTLMELLVATTLLSIVLSSVYVLFHSSIQTWKRLESGVNPQQDARLVMNLIGRDINNLIASAGHLFEGDDQQMTLFVITEPFDKDTGEGGHLMRIEYKYNRGQKRLEREEALVETALPKVPPANRELDRSRVKVTRKKKVTLVENVREFEITYIWIPYDEKRNWKEPPSPVEPVRVQKHKLCWWLPQGIEIKMALYDPDQPEGETVYKETFPIRAPSAHLTEEQLQKLLRDEL